MKHLNTLVVGLLLFTSTSYASGTHEGGHGSSMKKMKMNKKDLNEKDKKDMEAVLKANEELHMAFFKYDGKKVEKHAKSLLEKMNKIENSEISKFLAFSKKNLAEIKESSSREQNNEKYHMVSSALIYVIGKYSVNPSYDGYFCPMVKKKWIQNTSKMGKVHNPYASNMPHCGNKQ